jgi:hypothetical protein
VAYLADRYAARDRRAARIRDLRETVRSIREAGQGKGLHPDLVRGAFADIPSAPPKPTPEMLRLHALSELRFSRTTPEAPSYGWVCGEDDAAYAYRDEARRFAAVAARAAKILEALA